MARTYLKIANTSHSNAHHRTREPLYIRHPDTGEMVEVDFDCMERDPECIGKLRSEELGLTE